MYAISLGSAPALGILIPFVLGIFLQKIYHYSHGQGLLLLVCGIVVYVLALVVSGWYKGSIYTRQRMYRFALSLVLIGLGIVRMEVSGRHTTIEQVPTQMTIRDTLIKKMEGQAISSEVQRLTAAISLGYLARDEGGRALRKSFQLSGVAHILAVSGYHLGVVIMLATFLLRRLPLGMKLHYILLVAVAWYFTALTGYSIPTVRASLLVSLYYIGRMLGNQTNSVNLLASAALLQLLYIPTDLYSWGMWLSYSAVVSIYWFYKPIAKVIGEVHQPLLRLVWDSLAMTLAAQILVLPLCFHLFGTVSWSFIFTSIPMTLLSSLLIPIGLVSYLLIYLGVPLGVIADVVELLGRWMLAIGEWGSRMDILQMPLRLPIWGLLLFWLGAYFLKIYLKRRNGYRYAVNQSAGSYESSS